jgi:hypothetical protein
MVARDGVGPPTPAFSVALISIYNNLTGLRWLRKCFKSRGRQSYLGPGSWAGRIDFVHAAVESGNVLRFQLARSATPCCSMVAMPRLSLKLAATQADSPNSNCFGGVRRGSYRRRKDRANSFANRESSSALIITHVWKHNEVSESGFTTTPSARMPTVIGLVRIATPTCSDTK